MKLRNPFVIEGYSGKEYFCDREEEVSDMIKALRSGRNITLASPRRMGKTGLIKRVFEEAKEQGVKCFYFDIFNTKSLNDFIQLFANELLGGLDGPITTAFNAFAKAFKSCRPVLTPDSVTGMPSMTIEMRPGEEVHTLKEIFNYIASSDKECYIAIDEFQQVTEYPETNMEALLRSYIQFVPNATFVFAGSKKHLMQEMFSSPKRPFYQSTQPMPLRAIDKDKYRDFAVSWFRKAGERKLPSECFDHIYDTVMGHTWYIQYWLSILFDYSNDEISMTDVEYALNKILKLEEDNFNQYNRLMTDAQRRVAVAVAKEITVSQPYSNTFIKKYDLPATSTVKSAIKQLTDKDFLIEENGVYSVYNRFFMLWLQRL